jgi:signal transduction histidine kinase
VPTAGGSTLTMELDIVPVEEAGSVMGVLLQLTDVTDKRQLERQLLRSERLASLSQFASMFAHDIRNPLAGIKKTLELLGHRPELHTEPIAQWFGDLQFTTDLLLGMINDMLDVYQESYSGMPLVSSAFSAGVLLQEAAHLFRSEAEAKNVTFQLAMPDKNLTMTADRRRLQRVSINLVHNALKYSPAGGVITLSARRAGQEALPADVSLPDQAVLLICVEDEGPGMEPDELPHIFEMFFRKKDGHDLRIGRGLGLHFCRLVVEAHGGRIWAENRSTGGARFSVAVPLRAEVACRSSL